MRHRPGERGGQRGTFGVPKVCTDWRDVLREPIDAVLVLTAGSHAPMAIEAAKAGNHVLVEKPMCFSTARAQAMVDAAETAGVTLMVAYNKRYDPAYLRFQDEASALTDARLLRVTTFESPFQPYVAHYPLAPVSPAGDLHRAAPGRDGGEHRRPRRGCGRVPATDVSLSCSTPSCTS